MSVTEHKDHFHHHHDEGSGKSQKNSSIYMGKYVKCVHADTPCTLYPVD